MAHEKSVARSCSPSPCSEARRRRAAESRDATTSRRTSTIRGSTRPAGRTWSGSRPADKRVGKLLVFLPLGGAANLPTNFESIGSEAGRLGYHTIVLAYKNEVPIANADRLRQ